MTIAVDFDGPIHLYTKGWHDGTIYDEPVPGALDALHALLAVGPTFIFTTRDTFQVAAWLEERGVPCAVDVDPERKFWNTRGVVLVTNRKLAAHVYIDDRGIRFETWDQVAAHLRALGIEVPGLELAKPEAPHAAYLGFDCEPKTVVHTVTTHPSVLIDVDANGDVVGVEVISPPGPPRIETAPLDEPLRRIDRAGEPA